MAPDTSICKEVPKFHSIHSDYSKSNANTEVQKVPSTKSATASVGRPGISSSNGVHELLDCHICMSMMYPPIHQV